MRAALVMAAIAWATVACGAGGAHSYGGSVPTSTAPVVRTDIVARQQLPGTLTYSGAYTLVNQAGPGIYTALPTPGAVLSLGQVLLRVDNRPVPLLYGQPEWRTLSVGVADGPDVKQLEDDLLALGFGNNSNLIANGHFDSFDAAAIRRWQASLGVAQTGTFGQGDAIFEPGPVRIQSLHARVGMTASPGQPVIEATSTRRVVNIALDVNRQSLVRVGDAASVLLPDSSTTAGTIASIGSVATAAQSQGGPEVITIPVTVTLADSQAGSSFVEAPVIVSVTDQVHKGVLAVPVIALLGQPGGTFPVEGLDGSQRRTVTVTTGLYDDRGLVEVTAPELHEGMLVEVPQL